MYRDWYVAYVNQLSAEDTATFLLLTEVLRNPASEVSLLKHSLDEVRNHLEFNMQIYIFPYLAKIAVNKNHALQKEAKGIIRQICGNFSKSVADEVARNIDEPNIVRMQIRKMVNMSPASISLSEEDYIILTESIDGIMCLSALINYDKDMIHSIVQEELCAEFLIMALEGFFGRYVMVLAQETCLISDSANLFKEAKKRQRNEKSFYEFPDTIEVLLKFYFHGMSAQEILQLAFDPETLLFDRFVGECKESSEFWLSSGLPSNRAKKQYTKQLRILWENIAVYLGIQSAINEQKLSDAVNCIARYWEGQRAAYDMEDLKQSQDSRCPWMFRSNPVYTKAKDTPFAEYQWMGSQAVTLKAAMAAPILSLIFSSNREELPEFLYELVMNLIDAYSGPGISQSIAEGCFLGYKNAREVYFSEALLSLLAYAKRLLDYIGKGFLDNSVPGQLFLVVEKYSKDILNGKDVDISLQRKRLHCGPSVMVCAILSYEEASAEFPEVKKGDYWMRGGNESFARKICETALNDFWDYIRNSKAYNVASPEGYITKPIYLTYEHFPDLIEKSNIQWKDWMQEPKRKKLPKNTQAMLLPKHTPDEWETNGKITLGDYPIKEKKYNIAFAAIMHWIIAILEKKDSIDENERQMLSDWANALLKMNAPKDFPRSSRFLATEVLRGLLRADVFSGLSDKENAEIGKDIEDIIQIVVETIADLSKQTPFYQYAVAKVIIDSKLSDKLSDTYKMIKCIFFYTLLFQEKEAEVGNTMLTDPYRINQQKESSDIRRQIIFWYIGNISDQLLDERSNIRNRFVGMLEKWYQRNGYKKEKIIIEAKSIRIKGSNVSICNEKTGDDQWYEWEPDVLEVKEKSKKQTRWEREVFVKDEKGGYILLEKGGIEFFLEQGFCGYDPFKVVFQDIGKEGYLISAGTGNNYCISPEFIEEESLKNLQQRIYTYKDEHKKYPKGLYLKVRIDTNMQERIPRLKIEEFDTKNLEYMELFYDSEFVSLEEPDKRQIEKNGFLVEARTNNPEKDMIVEGEGWDACAQRCGIVKLRVVEKKQLEICGSDADIKQRIEFLYELHKGEDEKESFLAVRLIGKGGDRFKNSNLLQGQTKEKMPVKIEKDSIIFGNYRYQLKNYEDCIVIWTPGANKRVDAGNKCKGVICEIPKVAAKGNGLIKVKYIDNDKVHEGQVESFKLAEKSDINTIYVGMPVLYDKAAETMSPVFYFPKGKLLSARQYKVRYLWKMEICGRETVEKIQNNGCCVELGVHRIGNADVVVHLTQDFQSGKVYAVREDRVDQEKLDESALKVEITMCDSRDDLIDIHHLKEFEEEIEVISNAMDSTSQGRRLAKRCYERYTEWINSRLWLNKDSIHAEGLIVEENGGCYFEVKEPLEYFPCNRNDVSDEEIAKWTKRIKLIDDGVHLAESSKWAYAKIKFTEDGSFEADVDHTEALSWNQFQKWLHKNHKNKNEYAIPLFYVNEEGGNLHFEWGIGRHFMLPENRLKVSGSGQGTIIQWFYGDKISCFRIEGKGSGAVLIVEIENYDFSIEHRIKNDAEENIFQYVKVRFDKERDRVIAEESTVSKPRLSNEEHAWAFERVKAVGLKDNVEKEIKKAMPDGGKGCILVKLDKKKSKERLIFGMAELKSIKRFILCLKGGEICQKGNDYYVTFSTENPDCKMIGADSIFSVNVYRRSFSYNESTLRVYFGKDKNAFQKYMLVKVYNKDGNYQGDIKNLPWRPHSIVCDWLKRYGTQDVIVGKKHRKKNLMSVEIKPGVFCGAEFHEEIKEGVTGRLFLRGESVVVEAISCRDDDFLTEGRIVELLMLDSAFGNNIKSEQFTVAGMPQLKLGNQELADKLKRECPPRHGKILGGNLNAVKKVHFGFLKVEVETEGNSKKEKIVFKKRYEKQRRVNFRKITFFDAGISEIRNHIKRGQWHYHDSFAKVCDKRQIRSIPYGENSDLPIIFDDSWGLRFKEDELEKYIYPPHELEEYGLPEEQYGLNQRYPIAGRAEKGILVELSPGRIVKIPDSLLYIVDENKTIGKLCTKYICDGDIVKLSTSVPEPGKPMRIRLIDVEYGLRSLIRNKAFLPIIPNQRGCMVTGGGFYKLKYPEGGVKEKEICILNNTDNCVEYDEILPQSEDLVFLRLNRNNEINVMGFPDLSVHVIEDPVSSEKVKNGDWLVKLFSYEEGKKVFFQIMKNRIPMIVDKIADHEISVYYPHSSLPDENTILCSEVIGVLSKSKVCFRSGPLIHGIDISKEITLPGQKLAAEIAKRLKPGRKMWIHFIDNTYRIGCYKSKNYGGKDDKRKITVEEVLDCAGEHGFLCEDVLSHEFYWMPVENVCRAEHVSAKQVNEILFNSKKQISVEIDQRGYASYLKNNMTLSVPFDNLRPDDRNRIIKVVVCSEIKKSGTNMNYYTCYERPRGNIYLLQAELKHERNEKLNAYCIKKGENTAVLMPCNEVRTSIHLSQQLLRAVQKSYRGLDGQQKQEIRRDTLTALLKEHREEGKRSGGDLLCFSKKIIDMKGYGETDSSLIECRAEIPSTVIQYFNQLEGGEKGVTCMRLEDAIFLSAIAQSSNEDIWGEAGKNVADIIRKNKKYYCCEEILLRNWLLLSEYSPFNLRTLLDSVYLGGRELKEKGKDGNLTDQKNGSLTVNQVAEIRSVCETILRRNRDNEADEMVKLAVCLLEISGQMENYAQYDRELQEAIEKTKCYEVLCKEVDDAAKYIINLPEEDAFHSVGAQESSEIYRVFDSVIKKSI